MRAVRSVMLAMIGVGALCLPARAQTSQEPFKPQVGQAGKDVVWVPTTPELVEKMLDLAQVTKKDVVVDLGSGDGRNVIAAAKRGARARGVEFNPEMVALSRRLAEEAGVADKAKFVEGDMFEADISDATVLALFLLPSNMTQLRPTFFALKPGTRIVANTFGIEGWAADQQVTLEGECMAWCSALLWIVPAKVNGTWRTRGGELTLRQEYQYVTGSLTRDGVTIPVVNGRLRGEEISFVIDGATYTGRVSGDRLKVSSGESKATVTLSASRVVR